MTEETQEVLEKGNRHRINVKPLRLGVFTSIQTVAKMVSPDEKAAFVDRAVGKVENVMGYAHPNKKKIRDIKTVKNILKTKSILMIQTDKSRRCAILPESSSLMRTEKTMNFLFHEWGGNT